MSGLGLYILGGDGSVRWDFDLASAGYHTAGNDYSYRYAAPYLYLVVSEERHSGTCPASRVTSSRTRRSTAW